MTFGPSIFSGPGSYVASNVCFRSSRGCMMLDLPELFAPARIVSGAISISCLLAIDLNPSTAIFVIPSAMALPQPVQRRAELLQRHDARVIKPHDALPVD